MDQSADWTRNGRMLYHCTTLKQWWKSMLYVWKCFTRVWFFCLFPVMTLCCCHAWPWVGLTWYNKDLIKRKRNSTLIPNSYSYYLKTLLLDSVRAVYCVYFFINELVHAWLFCEIKIRKINDLHLCRQLMTFNRINAVVTS